MVAEQPVHGLHVIGVHLEPRPAVVASPRPGVAEPHRGQHVQRCAVRAAVRHRDRDAHVVGRAFGVRELDVEVAVLVEDPGVDQLVLRVTNAAPAVLRDEIAVRVRALRVLVQPLHPRVRRRRVERPPVLLHVFAVIALGVGETEEPFLEDGVVLVPQRDAEAQVLPAIADAAEPVLAPAVGARARVLVGEVVPRRAARAVVLAHGAPLARRQDTDPTTSTGPSRPGRHPADPVPHHRAWTEAFQVSRAGASRS